jgi:hypothetical protein
MQHRLHAHRLPVVARPANVVACRPLVASSPYLPLLWPVTMALVGAFFWGMWGDGRPKSPLAGAPETPATPTALAVLADVVAPADRRKRLEIADVFAAYAAASKARGAEVASADAFGTQAKCSPTRPAFAYYRAAANSFGAASS